MLAASKTAQYRLRSAWRRRLMHSWHDAERLVSRFKADAYTTLGVSEKSPASEIKQQYYRICRQLHPDTQTARQEQAPSLVAVSQEQWRGMSVDERQQAMREQFSAVRDAYEVLADPQVRRKYDMMRQRRALVSSGRRWPAAVDPWAGERPAFTGRRKTSADARRERLLLWGVFGFLGVCLVLSNYQRAWSMERQLERVEEEHQRSMRMLATARARALEKWREVPPNHLGEYEARRLHSAQVMSGARPPGDGELVRQGEFHRLWPHGAGLGLLALLDESQVCGVQSRMRIANDSDLARVRPSAQRALARDQIVRRYLQPPNAPAEACQCSAN